MNAERAMLEVTDLRKDFEGLMAVFDVSFAVAPGVLETTLRGVSIQIARATSRAILAANVPKVAP